MPEIIRRIAQATAMLTTFKTIWKDKKIALKSKIRMMRSLVLSIFVYACESWAITSECKQLKCAVSGD